MNLPPGFKFQVFIQVTPTWGIDNNKSMIYIERHINNTYKEIIIHTIMDIQLINGNMMVYGYVQMIQW